MRSNHMYRDIFRSKYGGTNAEELAKMILRPPELLLSSDIYGPNGNFQQGLSKLVSNKVFEDIQSIADAYQTSSQCLDERRWADSHPAPEGKHQLTLTPTLFWYVPNFPLVYRNEQTRHSSHILYP